MRKLGPEELTAEEALLSHILQHNPGREIRIPVGPGWGRVILPAKGEHPDKNSQGLRVLAFCSWTLGFLSFETLKEMERKFPDKINLVGLVTDDPLDKDARISMKKRFWRYYDEHQREEFELGIIESALTFGIPSYTGEVKNDYFRNIMAGLDPQVIIVSAFGQAIDQPIIAFPPYGIYNVHPSDLRHHFGAGPQPWEDLIARKARTTRVTLHHVSEAIDTGLIVGQSPPINVRLADGESTDNVRLVGEKTLLPVDHMVAELMSWLMERHASGSVQPIDHMDFESLFSQEFKDKLMKPIDPAKRGRLLPLPVEDLAFTV